MQRDLMTGSSDSDMFVETKSVWTMCWQRWIAVSLSMLLAALAFLAKLLFSF